MEVTAADFLKAAEEGRLEDVQAIVADGMSVDEEEDVRNMASCICCLSMVLMYRIFATGRNSFVGRYAVFVLNHVKQSRCGCSSWLGCCAMANSGRC